MNCPIKFLDRKTKAKLVPACFFLIISMIKKCAWLAKYYIDNILTVTISVYCNETS